MKNIKFSKRLSASMLAIALCISSGTSLVKANILQQQEDLFEPIYGIVDSKEVPYLDNDRVNIIIELDGRALLDNKQQMKKFASVSEFLNSNSAKTLKRKIEIQRKNIIKKLEKSSMDIQVEYEYSAILNGISVEAKYKDLEKIRKMFGVKNAYISKKYDKIEPVSYQPYVSDSTSTDECNSYSSYSGKGTMIAILDDGMELTHQAFQGEVHAPKYKKSDIENCLKHKMKNIPEIISIDEVYHSQKIPFAYDYADGDTDVTGGDHGVHVSGIAIANNGEIRGVAPDAQLAFMKVFSDDGSADEADIFAALEDSIELGVDVINMSLGSTAGFTDETGLRGTEDVYKRVVEAGIGLMVAAGNEGTSSYQYNRQDDTQNLSFVGNPDNGTVGSPSTYIEALSVASANSGTISSTYMVVSGANIEYLEVGNTSNKLNSIMGEKEYLDYDMLLNKSEINGKIALMKGEKLLSSEIEVKNELIKQMEELRQNGAIGIILYLESKRNNDELRQVSIMLEQPFSLPIIAVSAQSGQYMIENLEKKIEVIVEETKRTMSNFSSWGVTPDLKLKPEITAFGGKIKSAISNNRYGTMSGTSMASPYISGCFSVLKEYLHNIPISSEMNSYQKEELINTLMMCTAKPLVDPSTDIYYSPRKQGAGIVQPDKAMTTKGYLTVDDGKRPKAELGYHENGDFQFSFDVHNMSSDTITYQVEVTVLTESTKLDSSGKKRIAQQSRKLNGDEVSIKSLKEVEVTGNTKQTIPISISLTEIGKARLDEEFPNGIFIDGYVTLIPMYGDVVTLSIPFVGFYGDWNRPPVFDGTIFDEEEFISLYPSEICIVKEDGNVIKRVEAGANLYVEGIPRQQKFIAIKGDGRERVVPVITLLRGAKMIHQKLVKNGILLYEEEDKNVYKSYYDPYYKQFMQYVPESYFYFSGYKEKGNIDGKYTYKVEAKVDGILDKVQSMEFPVVIDSEKPTVLKKEIAENEDGTSVLNLTVQDNHYIQAVCLVNENSKITEWKMPEAKDEGARSHISFDVSQSINLQEIDVALVDYAGNGRVVKLANVPTHIEKDEETTQVGEESSQVGSGLEQGGGNSFQTGNTLEQGGGDTSQIGNGNTQGGSGFPLGGTGGTFQGGIGNNLLGGGNVAVPSENTNSNHSKTSTTISTQKGSSSKNVKRNKKINAKMKKEKTYKELVAAYKKAKINYLKVKKQFLAEKIKFKGDIKNKKYILQKQNYLKVKKQCELRKKEMNLAKKAVEKKKAEMQKNKNMLGK